MRTSGHAEKRALQPVPPALLPASQKPCMEARFKCICMQWDFKPPSSPIQFEPLYTPIYSERSNSSSPANGSTERGPLSGCSHPPPGKGLKFQSNARFKGPHPPHVMSHASPAARQGKGEFRLGQTTLFRCFPLGTLGLNRHITTDAVVLAQSAPDHPRRAEQLKSCKHIQSQQETTTKPHTCALPSTGGSAPPQPPHCTTLPQRNHKESLTSDHTAGSGMFEIWGEGRHSTARSLTHGMVPPPHPPPHHSCNGAQTTRLRASISLQPQGLL